MTRADHNGKIFFPPLSFSIHPYNIFFSSFYCPIIFFFYFFSFCPRDIILLVRFFLHQQYPLSLPFIPVFIIFLVLSQNILLSLSVPQVITFVFLLLPLLFSLIHLYLSAELNQHLLHIHLMFVYFSWTHLTCSLLFIYYYLYSVLVTVLFFWVVSLSSGPSFKWPLFFTVIRFSSTFVCSPAACICVLCSLVLLRHLLVFLFWIYFLFSIREIKIQSDFMMSVCRSRCLWFKFEEKPHYSVFFFFFSCVSEKNNQRKD